jgi:BetI-type transcriptional repressor, C-terminal
VIAAYARGLWRTVTEQPATFQLLNDLVVLGLRSPSLRPSIAEYQRQLDAAFEEKFREAAAHVGLGPARSIEDVARFFFAGIDGLLVHRLSRQCDDEADQRTLDDLVQATTALAEGHGALSR